MSGRYALFGHPVAHSQSPRIQRAFAAQTGIDCAYELIDAPPAAFPAALREFFAHGGRGANITLPHKETAGRLADQLSDRARAAGAVNTLRHEADGSLLGDNTDGIGLVRDLTANNNIKLAGARILICGAGGAARGILPVLLAENPAQLVLANRTHARARELARQFTGCTAQEYAALRGQTFDLVLNATSASLRAELPALPAGIVAAGGCTYDLAYRDTPTVFQQWSKTNGARLALAGWGMLVEQAAESFWLWHGVRPATHALLEPVSK